MLVDEVIFHKEKPNYNRHQFGFYTLDQLVPVIHCLHSPIPHSLERLRYSHLVYIFITSLTRLAVPQYYL
ncbi:hypothetical protein E4U01_04425 [Streptococcus acidominimus]|uniref:Uncharacterized protein n=1 Tax=Streptococcus acidominimus TaxID=1326 RepID=A0A4Y9FRJ6_STRAI|nr:hypothetical protein E4U01_04425 [Streptococcus acidominimus]